MPAGRPLKFEPVEWPWIEPKNILEGRLAFIKQAIESMGFKPFTEQDWIDRYSKQELITI